MTLSSMPGGKGSNRQCSRGPRTIRSYPVSAILGDWHLYSRASADIALLWSASGRAKGQCAELGLCTNHVSGSDGGLPASFAVFEAATKLGACRRISEIPLGQPEMIETLNARAHLRLL